MSVQNARQARRMEYRIGPGASTLLMIIVAVSLAVLGALALVSALGDARLSERAQAQVVAYYAAAARAQRELAVIDGRLAGFRASAADPDGYRERVLGMENDGIGLLAEPGEDDESALLVSFSVEMYQDQEIFVMLEVPVSLTGPRYRVASHVMRNIGEWQPYDDLELYDFDGFEDWRGERQRSMAIFHSLFAPYCVAAPQNTSRIPAGKRLV